MRRLLMVSYYFPPLGGIGSLRALKLANDLADAGWDAVVLAPRDGAYHRDPTLAFPAARVIRTGSLELSRLAKRVIAPGTGDVRPVEVGPGLGRLRALVRRWVYWPDAQIGWYPFALRAARRANARGRFDAIYSSSFPITAHLVARRLARETGIPWVAEFRDPWSEAIDPSEERLRRRAEALEASLLADCRGVVAPSPRWAELYRRKGAPAVAVITNGFDPADLPARRPVTDFVLTHVGSFYRELESLTPVWTALGDLRRRGELGRFRLRIVGDAPPAVRTDIAAHGLADVTEYTGFLSYREALTEMMAATALLLAGPPGTSPRLGGWIPAKTFEYLGSGLPIVYAGDPDSDAAVLLAGQPGTLRVPPGDVEGARRALLAARAMNPVNRQLDGFTRRALAAALGRFIDRICG